MRLGAHPPDLLGIVQLLFEAGALALRVACPRFPLVALLYLCLGSEFRFRVWIFGWGVSGLLRSLSTLLTLMYTYTYIYIHI